jgi:hypothetical protein
LGCLSDFYLCSSSLFLINEKKIPAAQSSAIFGRFASKKRRFAPQVFTAIQFLLGRSTFKLTNLVGNA